MVRETTGSERLASGYTRAAAFAYKSGASWGLCQYLHKLHPTVCAPCDVQVRFAADLAMPRSPPKMRRRSMSQSNETVASSESTRVRAGDSPVAEDSLDSLAVIRASLALAQEQDPAILLKTLLRLLCQVSLPVRPQAERTSLLAQILLRSPSPTSVTLTRFDSVQLARTTKLYPATRRSALPRPRPWRRPLSCSMLHEPRQSVALREEWNRGTSQLILTGRALA